MPLPEDDPDGDRSILKELVFNQYQAIVLAGVAAVAAIGGSVLPLALWGGMQLVVLPLLDSRPLRGWVARRRRRREREAAEQNRGVAREALLPQYARHYQSLQQLCAQIEANYQQLNGLSQAYLHEQRAKLDQILDGCLHRLLALQRYEATLERRSEETVSRQIASLEREVAQPDLPERARAAVAKNIELKKHLLESLKEARGTMKALVTELDSMTSLLEVLLQNSIAMRDPQEVAAELDAIVQQSQDTERVVREMEALVRMGAVDVDVPPPIEPIRSSDDRSGGARRRERNR